VFISRMADTAVRPYKQSLFNAGRPNAREKSGLADQ
jgi:hypothetical protein